jgi:hypothetical protein
VKTIGVIAIALVIARCGDRISPTEPSAELAVHVQPDDLKLVPSRIVLHPGESQDALLRAPWAYPLGSDCVSMDPAVAEIKGRIDFGESEGVAHITAVREGRAQVLCWLYNFARPPGSRVIGEIIVTSDVRRRSVRH